MKAQISLLLVAILVCCSSSANGNRIVGGTLTSIATHKHLVQVRISNEWICGGTLVTDQHVVTAAHCVAGRTPAVLSIKAGSSFVSVGGKVAQVTNVWPHPAYDNVTMEKDIAVLKLANPITGTNIKPAPLCSVHIKGGETVMVAGWGDTLEDGNPSDQLRVIELPAITYDACKEVYADRLFGSMICASQAGRDSCQGDSGGPLTKDGELCGVVSWGDGCAQPGTPGVYTSVMRMLSFIETKIAL